MTRPLATRLFLLLVLVAGLIGFARVWVRHTVVQDAVVPGAAAFVLGFMVSWIARTRPSSRWAAIFERALRWFCVLALMSLFLGYVNDRGIIVLIGCVLAAPIFGIVLGGLLLPPIASKRARYPEKAPLRLKTLSIAFLGVSWFAITIVGPVVWRDLNLSDSSLYLLRDIWGSVTMLAVGAAFVFYAREHGQGTGAILGVPLFCAAAAAPWARGFNEYVDVVSTGISLALIVLVVVVLRRCCSRNVAAQGQLRR